MGDLINDIVDFWASINPVAGYTSGYMDKLTELFFQDSISTNKAFENISLLNERLQEIQDEKLRYTAQSILLSLKTQLIMSRPSGAGPSGTGMGGVWGAADGIFYLVLKGDYDKPYVPDYLNNVSAMVDYETKRWYGQSFSIEVCKECLNASSYMIGTLNSLLDKLPEQKTLIDQIKYSLEGYNKLFYVDGLDSNDFNVYWPVFKKMDSELGPLRVNNYPDCLKNYYQLTETEEEINDLASGWLQLDLPITIQLCDEIAYLLNIQSPYTIESVWNTVSQKYKVDFDIPTINKVVDACDQFGKEYIILHDNDDKVLFDPTPSYLVNLVTGGEDFAVNYLSPERAYSQLYLTASKNTSMLTMINILVHEASHGYNFVLSAKNASMLLNLNTSLEVPMTEGQAFYREYQYWAAAQKLLYKSELNQIEENYMKLYGDTREEQVVGVLCAQLETYIWRVIRYIRALCDVRVNGGYISYTEFINWASNTTGLSEETLHGECFTFLAAPGYAPCYTVGCASYADLQKMNLLKGVSEIDFNTYSSKLGFYAWPINKKLMEDHSNLLEN